MDQALVKNAEDEIDDHHRDDEQQAETFEGALKLRCCPLKSEVHTGRDAEFGGGPTHGDCSLIKRDAGLEIEVKRNCWKLSEMIDGEGSDCLAERGDGREGNEPTRI